MRLQSISRGHTESEAIPKLNETDQRSSRTTKEGSRFVERILTVVTTLRQQKRDALEFLTTACQNNLGQRQALSLLPESH
jgi:hypothetical protein